MQTYLSTRPKSFSSVEQAIKWHLTSRTIRNKESARVSVPGLLVRTEGGEFVWRTELARTQGFWEGMFLSLCVRVSMCVYLYVCVCSWFVWFFLGGVWCHVLWLGVYGWGTVGGLLCIEFVD
jgi:hypothetical protein